MKTITTIALLLTLLAPALALEDINEPGKKTSIQQHFEEGKNVFSMEHQEEYLFVVHSGLLSLRRRTNKRKQFHLP